MQSQMQSQIGWAEPGFSPTKQRFRPTKMIMFSALKDRGVTSFRDDSIFETFSDDTVHRVTPECAARQWQQGRLVRQSRRCRRDDAIRWHSNVAQFVKHGEASLVAIGPREPADRDFLLGDAARRHWWQAS